MGGIAAFVAFTFPSFILLYILAIFNISQNENILISNIITGLKLFALVIVSDAIITMFKNFCKNNTTKFIFILSTLILIFFSSLYVQFIVLITAAIISSVFLKEQLSPLISDENFILAYSFAQAVPGPRFSISSYLGGRYFKESVF